MKFSILLLRSWVNRWSDYLLPIFNSYGVSIYSVHLEIVGDYKAQLYKV